MLEEGEKDNRTHSGCFSAFKLWSWELVWFGSHSPSCSIGVTSWLNYLCAALNMISGILPSLSKASVIFSIDKDNFELELNLSGSKYPKLASASAWYVGINPTVGRWWDALLSSIIFSQPLYVLGENHKHQNKRKCKYCNRIDQARKQIMLFSSQFSDKH